MSLVIRPVYDPVKAGALGITKASMMQSVKSINDGLPVGIYRDDEKKGTRFVEIRRCGYY